MSRRPEGWKLRKDPRSGIWFIRWRMDGRRFHRSTGEKDERAAWNEVPHVVAAATKRHGRRRGEVYFVQAGDDGPIKIGFAVDFKARFATMRTDSPLDLRLLGRLDGTAQDEKRLHQTFAELRIRGEWFRADPRLLGYIAGACKRAA